MKKLSFALILLALPCFSWGQLILVNATLSGSQEVPPRVTPATGTGFGTFDMTTNWFDFTVTFSGLIGTQTDAHFHGPGAIGVNAPVIIPLPLGSPIHFTGTLTNLQETQLLSGLIYVNIHSSTFPGGEIRGQLLAAVPEPSTYGLIGAAVLVGLIAYRRRAKIRNTLQDPAAA